MSDRERVRVEVGGRRVRVYLAGQLVADTKRPLLVWEKPYYPVYYFPLDDVVAELTPTGERLRSPSRGEGTLLTVSVPGARADGAAYRHVDSPVEEVRGHVAFRWDAMDSWFEEDEEVYIHARNPYTRVDILQSSRHVRVEIDGVTVAETSMPRLLFETSLPTRYYFPKTDVQMDLLEESDLHTGCPYKGTASYYHLVLSGKRYDDLVWWYPFPARESEHIAGYVAFYNEKVDIYVDGELETRPHTVFS
ncbi:MAG: DUF427 domain-containing protein [Acidimicrobiia bacterium]